MHRRSGEGRVCLLGACWRRSIPARTGPKASVSRPDRGIPSGKKARNYLHPGNARPCEKSATSRVHDPVSIQDSEPRGAAVRRSISQGHRGEIVSRAVRPRAFEMTNRDTCQNINRSCTGFGALPSVWEPETPKPPSASACAPSAVCDSPPRPRGQAARNPQAPAPQHPRTPASFTPLYPRPSATPPPPASLRPDTLTAARSRATARSRPSLRPTAFQDRESPARTLPRWHRRLEALGRLVCYPSRRVSVTPRDACATSSGSRQEMVTQASNDIIKPTSLLPFRQKHWSPLSPMASGEAGPLKSLCNHSVASGTLREDGPHS